MSSTSGHELSPAEGQNIRAGLHAQPQRLSFAAPKKKIFPPFSRRPNFSASQGSPRQSVKMDSSTEGHLSKQMDEKLHITSTESSTESVKEVPPHLSHDPKNNMKRSDPFQFGSRYLEQGDNVFEFNAWDHVETDDAYKEYTEQQLEMQRQAPVSDFDKGTLPLIHTKFGCVPVVFPSPGAVMIIQDLI